MLVTAGYVVTANTEQAGKFALGTRIGLHGKRIIAGDFAQVIAQILNDTRITRGLVARYKRVQGSEIGVGAYSRPA